MPPPARRSRCCAGTRYAVESAAFSPDGSRIVTASGDNTARIWDAASGKEIAVLGQKREFGGYCCGTIRRRLQPRRRAHRHSGASTRPPASGMPRPASEIAVLRRARERCSLPPPSAPTARASSRRQVRQDRAHLGRRDAARRSRSCAARGPREFRRLQPRRLAHRHGVSGQDRAHLGRRDRQGDRGRCAGTRTYLRFRRLQPRRLAHRHGVRRTRPPASGTPRAARRSRSCAGMRRSCIPPPSAPTGRASSRRQRTRPRASGTPRPASEIAVLRGHDGLVTSAAFSPDGRASSRRQADKTARVWDAATGKQIAVLRGHETGREVRRLQPRRLAHRHGVRGQDRPHLGRRERQGDRGPARPRGHA